MRKRELVALCSKWQRRLRLVDWRVEIVVKFVKGYPNSDAWVTVEEYTRTAEIEIDPRAANPERSLLHELTHMTISPVVPDGIAEGVEEQVVWSITDALLDTDRRIA